MARGKWVVHADGRRYWWKSWLHPRDRKGQFIETYAEVRTIAGMIGRVIGLGSRKNTVRVRRRGDRKEFDVPGKMLTVIARPDGKKPTKREGPDVGELRSSLPDRPVSPTGLKGAQKNETLAEWDADGLGNHLQRMFRVNGEDIDDRYAFGVARWKIRKQGGNDRSAAEIDAEIDKARRAAGLRPTPGDDEVRALLGQPDGDVWKAETGKPIRLAVSHRTTGDVADMIRSGGFDPNAESDTGQIFGNAVYVSVDDDSARRAAASLETREGYESRLDAVVNLRNPLVVEGDEDYDEDEVLFGDVVDRLVAYSLGISMSDLNERVTGDRNKVPRKNQLRQYLVNEGYDGIIYREDNWSGMGGSQVAVFDRNAIELNDDDDDDITPFRVNMLEPKGDIESGPYSEHARVVPMRLADMTPASQKRIQKYVDEYSIDVKAIEDEFFDALKNGEFRDFGRQWYFEEMQATAKRIAEATEGMKHPVSWQDALVLVAIFSARNEWEAEGTGNRWNEIHATRMAVAFASGAFDGLNARQIMDRSDPDITDINSPDYWEFGYIRDKGFGLSGAAFLTGELTRDQALGKAKRMSFYSNGLEPYRNQDVTDDVWMANPLARYSTRSLKSWQNALSPSGDPPKYLTDQGINASPVYVLLTEIVRRAHERGVAAGYWEKEAVPSFTQAAAWLQQKLFDREGT